MGERGGRVMGIILEGYDDMPIQGTGRTLAQSSGIGNGRVWLTANEGVIATELQSSGEVLTGVGSD
jgi:hypothetical protein